MKVIQLSFYVLISLLMQGVCVTEIYANGSFRKKPPPVEVIFKTTMGSFTLELRPDKAPKTVANFLAYVDEGFYNGTLFHRVIPRFIVQGGGFEKGMKKKQTRFPIINESENGLKNNIGTIAMARTRDPNSARSQFFINVAHNPNLDFRANQPGYTVFGKVADGMSVIDDIAKVLTITSGRLKDVPNDDIIILSAKRNVPTTAQGDEKKHGTLKELQERFTAGEHYVILENSVPTRDSSKIEVVEMFSYGCPHCYEFEPMLGEWRKRQAGDVDIWVFPAVWSPSMVLYAQAFYTAQALNITEKIHHPLFTAIVIEQKRLSNESELANFFEDYGVNRNIFSKTFNSIDVKNKVKQAEKHVRDYKPAGVPEIVVNGKYRIERMRAGGIRQMLVVADYLIDRERATRDGESPR